jgi:two-component system, OmpR family, phosphate regulon sensor histidine kinase PhoR
MADKAASEIFLKPSILVIDDEKRIRDACCKILTQAGFEVAEAESGIIGLELIEREHFDIILLDLMMPSLSGFDVLARVKALHPDTAIIVISGYATVEHSIEAMKKGAFDFIPKPFSPDQLRVVVAKAIEYTRALQDITEEKSRMRVFINHLTDGVMATDNQKRLVLANPAFLRLIGYQGTDAIGKQAVDVVDNEQLAEMIDQALSMPMDTFTEISGELKVGGGKEVREEIILGARSIPFRGRMERNLGTITVLHDITALKKMDQIKSDFVSMVAHEVRNPLNTIMAQLKIMLDGLAGAVSPKQQEILGRTSDKIKGLTDLCSELLDLAKMESGLIIQEKESLSVVDILKDQVSFHLAGARAKSIQLELGPFDEAIPPLLANRKNIEEVVSNLITNAVNYTPEGGAVTVSASVAGDYVCVSVRDSGIGIPETDRERIFDRFYRVKDLRMKYVVGTGLGLAIIKSIVEAHHGMIHVESELDRGTTFHVYLPLITS